MQIHVSSRHTEVSDALRATAAEKIGRLGRFLGPIARAEVHFSEEGHRNGSGRAAREVCEVLLQGHGQRVHCRAAADDGFAALDLAVAKLQPQLHRIKSREVARHHAGTRH